MDVPLNTSLTQRASVAVIASLWNRHDIMVDIKKLILEAPDFDPLESWHYADYEPWRDIENKVISLLQNILLPRELKSILNNLVQMMGMQAYNWIRLTQQTFQIYPNLPTSMRFVWNEKGILDYSKTAKLIIESSSDNLLCYLLACIFCMEETVLQFC